jgi:peptide subunit release factor 1 (eRF1)
MQAGQLDRATLRRLAELHVERGKVLSLYLNLDPSQFGTQPARSQAIRSLLDEADRRVREVDDLPRAERLALREDVERATRFFGGDEFAKGAHALALFICGPSDLFEALKLPRPVPAHVVIDDSPFVEPLAAIAPTASWCVLLVNRQFARVLCGTDERLDEEETLADDVHGWHDQGGLSQARYQRGIEKETEEHVKRAADAVFRRFQRTPFDRLLVGAPQELAADVESHLHPYLRERLAGRIHVDVENSKPDDVLRAALPVIEEDARRRERESLDRLADGVTKGRGAAGLDDVLGTLNERRVEILLVDEGFDASGVVCPGCGWIAGDGLSECPVDGTQLERRDDVTENAVELALAQSGEVLVVRYHDELAVVHGGIGAVLRF